MLWELAVLWELFWRWWHSVLVLKLLNWSIVNTVFPKPMHACLGSISMFLPGCFSLLPPDARFRFMVELCQELLVHPCTPPVTFGVFSLIVGMDHSWNWRRFLKWPKSALLKSWLVNTTICFIRLLSGSQTPPACGHCSQGCPQPLRHQPVLPCL